MTTPLQSASTSMTRAVGAEHTVAMVRDRRLVLFTCENEQKEAEDEKTEDDDARRHCLSPSHCRREASSAGVVTTEAAAAAANKAIE